MTFEEAWQAHRAAVERYMRRSCKGTPVEAEDVVQETFLTAWRIWDKRTGDNVRAWLIGISRRVFGHMMRALRCRAEGSADEYIIAKDSRSVAPSQEWVVMVEQLRQKFQGLGPAQAAALNGVAAGLDTDDIAAATGQSKSAVRMALSLGRKRLRAMG